jgi:Uma2 family endonuclease
MEKALIPNPVKDIELPDLDEIITEDDTPVDNLFSEKLQRLLTEPLYTSWQGGAETRLFLGAANVGLFYTTHQPAVVPDVFLSMDVEVAEDWYSKRHRTYLFWEFGKAPEVVIEVVSNREGGEDSHKRSLYARIGIDYYVIFDPTHQLSKETLRVFERRRGQYQKMREVWFEEVGLGLRLWQGSYENKEATWLRWCDRDGQLVPTGAELVQEERERAEQERQRAEQERQRAEQEAAARRSAESRAAQAEAELARLKTELGRPPEQND